MAGGPAFSAQRASLGRNHSARRQEQLFHTIESRATAQADGLCLTVGDLLAVATVTAPPSALWR
jgi:hypothetical protein